MYGSDRHSDTQPRGRKLGFGGSWGTFGAIALVASCHSASLPGPRLGPHQPGLERVIEATYPPPPAQPELITPAARRSAPLARLPAQGGQCVWIDGYWNWREDRWQWVAGSWVVPPANCYYAHPEHFWMADSAVSQDPGKLYYRLPNWYPRTVSPALGTPAPCAAPVPC